MDVRSWSGVLMDVRSSAQADWSGVLMDVQSSTQAGWSGSTQTGQGPHRLVRSLNGCAKCNWSGFALAGWSGFALAGQVLSQISPHWLVRGLNGCAKCSWSGLSSDNHLVDGPTDQQTDRHEQSNIPPLLQRGA
ncbi:hypothetical protein DPMN_018792 [Dreissena polymorpha]|uniref:Uncharacterized protein n=1 Tax=Dreissena polymorpha TaxID=45954 RepID=A0A9D4NFT5_DREPO|nr:hypothetical protein DPMN_018792 [Dreissena polymorpha]